MVTTITNAGVAQGSDLELIVDQRFEFGSFSLSFCLRVPAVPSHQNYASRPMAENPYGYFQILFQETEKAKGFKSPMTLTRVAGHGVDLAEELVPEALQSRFTALQHLTPGRLPKLHIVSNESSIPWELVRIHDPSRKEPSFFLAESFIITRWIKETPGCFHLPLRCMALVVPRDSGLPSAEKERAEILERLRGRGVQEVAANPQAVIDAMDSGNYDGWHFAGHGDASGSIPDIWPIQLEKKQNLQVSDIVDRRYFGKKRPLVFLNSCRSGRGAVVLTQVNGWAQAFVKQAGAGAFIGTHWAITDAPAAEFSAVFYQSFLEGMSISEAAQTARLQIRDKYKNDPTWLAYTVFAQPGATCTAAESADFPQAEVSEPPPPPKPPEELPPRPGSNGPKAAALGGLVLLMLILGVLLLQPGKKKPNEAQNSGSRRPAVSVLTFYNQKAENDEFDWLTAALPEVLSTELGFDKAVRVIDREEVAAAEVSLGIPPGKPSVESLRRLKVLLGTENFLFGTFKNIGDSTQMEIEISLWRLPNESPVWQAKKLTDEAAWSRLAESLADVEGKQPLRQALGVRELSATLMAKVIESFPQKKMAARLYGQGLMRRHRYELNRATEFFADASQVENHPRVALSLAQTLIPLGRLSDANSVLDAASQGKFRLSPQEQLEWNLTQAQVDLSGSEIIAGSQALNEGFFWDDISHALDQVSFLVAHREWAQASRLLDEIRQRYPEEESANPDLALAVARVSMSAGELESAHLATATAINKANFVGAAWQESAARMLLASILLQLNQQPEAFASYQRAAELVGEFGDEVDPGFQFAELLATAENTSNPGSSENFLRLALEDAKRSGNLGLQIRILTSLRAALLLQGDIVGAQQTAAQAIELNGDSTPAQNAGYSQAADGYSYFLQGKFNEAKAKYEQASEIFSKAGESVNFAIVALNLGELAGHGGLLAAAREHCDAARQTLIANRSKAGLANAEALDGTLHLLMGDYERAEAMLGSAAAELKSQNDEIGSWEVSLKLAELYLITGRTAQSRKSLEAILDNSKSGKFGNYRAQGYSILGRCRLVEGQEAEARELLSLASKLKITDFRAESQLRLAKAYLSATEGRASESITALLEVEKQAEARGQYLYLLEARLAAGEIELNYGNHYRGIELLQSLVQQGWRGNRSHIGQFEKRALAALGAAKALPIAARIPTSKQEP